MKKMAFLVFLVIFAAPAFPAPYSPFPSPLFLTLDVGFAHDFYEYSLSDSIKLTADIHGILSPAFSVYPGSIFPFLRASGGTALGLSLPFYFMLSLSADTGVLVNPMIGFDTKWIDFVYTIGVSGFAGFYYHLTRRMKIRTGGKIRAEFFTSFLYPVPFHFYYSGELVVAVYFAM